MSLSLFWSTLPLKEEVKSDLPVQIRQHSFIFSPFSVLTEMGECKTAEVKPAKTFIARGSSVRMKKSSGSGGTTFKRDQQ